MAERKRRLFVIVPANLRKQWSVELADKFHLPSTILETKSFNAAVKAGNLNPFDQAAILLCSYQFARSKEAYVSRTEWDLVVIDEGLPRLPEPPFRRAVPTTPADRAGAHVDCFPAHTAFPKWQEGRHPHCHFRGLLRLHSRYGPSDCSAAYSGLCHEAPALPVTRPSRSSASRSIDNSLGGIFLH